MTNTLYSQVMKEWDRLLDAHAARGGAERNEPTSSRAIAIVAAREGLSTAEVRSALRNEDPGGGW